MFRKQGEFNPKNTNIRLWQQRSHSIELHSEAVTRQKPVRAGSCYRAEDYVYSSASFYAGLEAVLDVQRLF